MLFFLNQILQAMQDFPNLIVAGVDTVINGLFAATAAFVGEMFALLPSMPSAPSFVSGQWAGWLNWFFPVRDLLAGFFSLIVMYVTYLGVSYALKVVRAL